MRKLLISNCVALMLGLTPALGIAASSSGSALLTPVKAVASSFERGDINADKVFDNNLNTRWGSGFSDNQWIYLDFGTTANFTGITIYWERAYATDYQIQTSVNATSWTTIKTVNGSVGGVESLNLSGSGRYLRVAGIKRATQYGYSIFEIQTKGTTGAVTTSSKSSVNSSSSVATVSSASSIKVASSVASSLTASSTRSTQNSSVSIPTGDTIPVNYKDQFVKFTKLTTPAPYPANKQTPYPIPTPTGVEGYTPLYAPGTPVMEQIQYSEPDGTLVTLVGYRPTPRHAREWGENWFLNDSDNAANLWNNLDEHPGAHSEFPSFYFQNRTFGLVIRDEVPAGRSRVTTYVKVNQGKMLNVGISGFHSMNPMLQGFGWSALHGSTYIPDTTFKTGGEVKANYCPAEGGLFDCITDKVYLAPYNNENCDPTWSPCEAKPTQAGFTNPNPTKLDPNIRTFSVGDLIELTPAFFLEDRGDGNALDGGGKRYYSEEKLYVVGKGMRAWYGVVPRLNNKPLPESTLSGGETSTSYNYSEEPFRSFQLPAENIGIANIQRFVEGRRLFHTSFQTGQHSENPNVNPVFTAHIGQLGPRYNGERCLSCHLMNGRSKAPEQGQTMNTLSVLTAAASGVSGVTPDATYGMNIQQLSKDASATNLTVKVSGFKPIKTVTLSDGSVVDLQKPTYEFSGPVPAQYSVRQASQVIGLGLLEAMDESAILNLADPSDADGDGIRGTPNWVIDPETGAKHLGRFGWKASKGTIRQQVATALMLDMGVTTPVYPTRDCQKDLQASNCKFTAQTTAGVDNTDLKKLVNYIALVGVPAQRSIPTEWENPTQKRIPAAYKDANTSIVAQGKKVFEQINCSGCHKTELKTGNNHPFAELRNQVIHPYTDLLLHDMGPGLADNYTEGNAQPQLWRTQPLWGIGLLPFTSETDAEMKGVDISHGAVSNARYLHDGRARTLVEAIEWHDGEAAKSRMQFEALSTADRNALLNFLRTL